MGHVVSRQPWGVIDVDTTEGRIFFQQEWFYTWTLLNATVSPWTHAEKQHFHNTLDRQIWAAWSNRVRLQVAGATPFARAFAARGVLINFDIKWVTRPGHWAVTVRKMPPGSDPTTFISNVTFSTRQIELDTADLASYAATNAAGQNAPGGFFAGPHEYGHTLDNRDEYNNPPACAPGTPVVTCVVETVTRLMELLDTTSIMNVGRQLRPRHMQLIVTTLNTMMPGVRWSAPPAI